MEVVAPAFSCSKRELQQALLFLQKWGLNPKVPTDLFGKDLLCSHTDKTRFGYLKKALLSKDSPVIFCLRGGYGSTRLLPFLQEMKKPSQPKLLVGYSDMTALHSFINDVWKWPSLHAPHLIDLNCDLSQVDGKNLKKILFGQKKIIEFHGLKPLNHAARMKKNFPLQAPLSGGNLSVLTSLIGTPWIQCLRSKVVVLEDVGERAYRLDRMLTQWSQAGVFHGVKALIFGTFLSEPHPSSESLLIRKVLQRCASQMTCPVFGSLPFGHGKRQMPLPFMTQAELLHPAFLSSEKCRKNLSALRVFL